MAAQPGGRDPLIGRPHDGGDALPCESDIEPHSKPATRSHVLRYEEVFGLSVNMRVLHSVRGVQPERYAPIPVVIHSIHCKNLRAANPVTWHSMRDELFGLRECETEFPDGVVELISHLMSLARDPGFSQHRLLP